MAVLTLLRIKNLALVEELEWQMNPGFIAVTGETGAGKSIIIGALQLLLGERADKSLIRTGADLCTVDAVFTGNDLQKLNLQLVEAGVEPCENDLIIKRSFSATGGTRQFINGSPTTLSILKNLGDDLVDLHGPHDHQSLLSPEKQLSLLDSFARAKERLDEYRKQYRQLQTWLTEHAALNTAETAREQELDLLRQQGGEIKTANDSDSIIYDPASQHIFAFNGDSHSASVIDPVSATVVKTIDMGGGPEFAAAAQNRATRPRFRAPPTASCAAINTSGNGDFLRGFQSLCAN